MTKAHKNYILNLSIPMNCLSVKLTTLSTCLLILSACTQHNVENKKLLTQQISATAISIDQPAQEQIQLRKIENQGVKVEDVQWLNLPTWSEVAMVVSSKNKGLQFLDQKHNVVHQIEGQFGRFDYRVGSEYFLFAATNLQKQQIELFNMDLKTKAWHPSVFIPKRDFKAEAVCLYTDQQGLSFAFLVGEEGLGEQWLIANQQQVLQQPRLVRKLSFPPESNFCKVNDVTAELLINEPNVGVWAYPAHSEADLTRKAVDMVKPFGSIQSSPAAIAIVDDQVAVIDEKYPLIYRYQKQNNEWKVQPALQLDTLKEAKSLSIQSHLTQGNALNKSLLILDDKSIKMANIDWATEKQTEQKNIVTIAVETQTDVVPSTGDAADDPAIWHNLQQPSQSRILATDKQGGLQVYDLSGKTLQYLAVGRLNNVDVRSGFRWGNQTIDLAIATNRDHNSLHLFAIEPMTGKVSELGQLATTLDDIYGFCMYQDQQGEIYAIPNDKNGTFIQYQISALNKKLKAQEIQRFSVKTQPEGCVVDDRNGHIFLGEEDVAVWVKDLNPQTQTAMQQVIAVGDILHDDIEGLGLYHGKNQTYLIISSQGNDSYVVVEAKAPYVVRGAFRLGINPEKGIDAVSETDGLAVSSKNFSGIWQEGIFVVQDGRKRMPEANQNYKYVPWSKIAQALKLD